MISNIDANVGRVLDALDNLGLRENTLLVFMADHGDNMGDHWLLNKGPFHFDGLIRVPFIWSWPGRIKSGMVTHALTSLLDFAPTVLDFCGVPVPVYPAPEEPPQGKKAPWQPPFANEPKPWPGHSLRSLLEGGNQMVRQGAFVDHDDDASGLRLRTLVTERYRLTWYVGQQYGELFDLQEDPAEMWNLWNDDGRRSIRSDLVAQLLDEACQSDYSLPRMLTSS